MDDDPMSAPAPIVKTGHPWRIGRRPKWRLAVILVLLALLGHDLLVASAAHDPAEPARVERHQHADAGIPAFHPATHADDTMPSQDVPQVSCGTIDPGMITAWDSSPAIVDVPPIVAIALPVRSHPTPSEVAHGLPADMARALLQVYLN
jgi:hypothetical protein